MQLFSGYYGLVARTSESFLILIGFVLIVAVLYAIRQKTESYAYNNALSSDIGDTLMLIAFLGTSHELLQAGLPHLSVFWCVCSILAAAGAMKAFSGDLKNQTWADRYHAVFIAPIVAFIGINTLALLVSSHNATPHWLTCLGSTAIWIVLVRFDLKTGRSRQTYYLKRLGFQEDKDGRLSHPGLS